MRNIFSHTCTRTCNVECGANIIMTDFATNVHVIDALLKHLKRDGIHHTKTRVVLKKKSIV
jgi:hypothetical protein